MAPATETEAPRPRSGCKDGEALEPLDPQSHVPGRSLA